MDVLQTDPPAVFYETRWENWTYNSSNISKSDCTNEYCVSDEDYIAMIEDYISPSTYEWVLISLHLTVFIVGLVGNALVCVSVYRNHSMRTVTNYFIVNLAVADFLVILICLPPTVLWDVTKTWFFGSITCKLVLYLQVSF
ncbi:Orexin receptor type 2 [Araneus ventricosus]|uniref:Orexin receptor type 2 n=1 Tax=Araneus ventricosus TaxID=182803 RepID=A0A4Y2GA61_ARAVE|nr:Orexin receptor type 2 [Araneus ventricosus]